MKKVLLLGSSGFVGSSLRDEKRADLYLCHHTTRSLNGSSPGVFFWDVLDVSTLNPTYDVIIHAATPASAELNASNPKSMYELNVRAMTNVIEFAARHETPPIVLFTSSGAVYGDMPIDLERFPEGWTRLSSFLSLSSAYAEGKIAAESLLVDASSEGKCVGLLARLFAFSGVHLPLDRHFAIGNFVRDVISTQTISIRGDGSPIRSYMDGQDMAQWLLRIIDAGSSSDIYHVGSERAISIRDLATLVGERYQLLTETSVKINVLGQTSPLDGVSRYVPSTDFTQRTLGVRETITLEDSIDRMISVGLRSL